MATYITCNGIEENNKPIEPDFLPRLLINDHFVYGEICYATGTDYINITYASNTLIDFPEIARIELYLTDSLQLYMGMFELALPDICHCNDSKLIHNAKFMLLPNTHDTKPVSGLISRKDLEIIFHKFNLN